MNHPLITKIFEDLLEQFGSIDIAEAEVKRMMHADSELHTAYREWCREVGSSEKNGFFDYCDEFRDSRDSVWDSLNDFDE